MYAPKVSHNNNCGCQSMPHRGSNIQGKGSSGFHRNSNWSQPHASVSFGNSGPMSSRTPCQIYNRSGHNALDCYQRMNNAYEGRIPTQKLKLWLLLLPPTINQPHGFQTPVPQTI